MWQKHPKPNDTLLTWDNSIPLTWADALMTWEGFTLPLRNMVEFIKHNKPTDTWIKQ